MTTRPTDNQSTYKQDAIKAANQTILTILIIVVPTLISFITNPNDNVINNILIVFIFGTPILLRLIVYSVNN